MGILVKCKIITLWERIEKEWEDILASECQKLIGSMPRRIEAVIKANGGYTKYLNIDIL